jgi:hypothetical protein
VDFNVIGSPTHLPVRPIKEADSSDFYRRTGSVNSRGLVKYWEIIADKLSKAMLAM